MTSADETLEAMLTLPEAGKIIGASRSSMYRLTDSGELPYVDLPARRMIRPADLRAYVNARIVRRLPKGLEAARA